MNKWNHNKFIMVMFFYGKTSFFNKSQCVSKRILKHYIRFAVGNLSCPFDYLLSFMVKHLTKLGQSINVIVL
jgi:hypothetical protein